MSNTTTPATVTAYDYNILDNVDAESVPVVTYMRRIYTTPRKVLNWVLARQVWHVECTPYPSGIGLVEMSGGNDRRYLKMTLHTWGVNAYRAEGGLSIGASSEECAEEDKKIWDVRHETCDADWLDHPCIATLEWRDKKIEDSEFGRETLADLL